MTLQSHPESRQRRDRGISFPKREKEIPPCVTHRLVHHLVGMTEETMEIIKLTTKNHQKVISQTLAVLHSGGLVVFPSDTVYGLLADAKNPEAVSQLLQFKERKPGHAISVFVADKKMAEEYIELNQNAKNVIDNLLPGPFTVIAQCQPRKRCPFEAKVDKRLLAENGTLGIRIPDYPLILDLVRQYGRPLTATSANITSTPPHYSIESFLKSISSDSARSLLARTLGSARRDLADTKSKKLRLIDLFIDAGKLPKNKPSTVIDTTTGQLKTLRIGDLLPATSNSFISKSERQTKNLGRFLATKFIKKSLSKPLVFLLEGNLGTGKTIFTKGLGKALGIKEEIVSPTYTLAYEYPITQKFGKSEENSFLEKSTENATQLIGCDRENRYPNTILSHQLRLKSFVHYDLYRIESENELKEIGLLENITCGNVYAIEWPERIPETIISALKKRAEIVYIKLKSIAENEREIRWK